MAIYSGFSHKKWWFSIAMLVHQRVFWITNPVHGNCREPPGWWWLMGPHSHELHILYWVSPNGSSLWVPSARGYPVISQLLGSANRSKLRFLHAMFLPWNWLGFRVNVPWIQSQDLHFLKPFPQHDFLTSDLRPGPRPKERCRCTCGTQRRRRTFPRWVVGEEGADLVKSRWSTALW